MVAKPSAPLPWAKVTREQIDEAAKHGVPVAFENRLGMRFVLVPAGTFLMGSPGEEEERRTDETQHEVSLSYPYYVQITELTNAQLRKCDKWDAGRDHHSGDFRGHPLDESDQPAVQVSWDMATAFAHWLSNEDRPRRYVLPTEAQWEFACRAGARSRFWWGASRSDGWRCANAHDERSAGSMGI